jgi:hypothetical protein
MTGRLVAAATTIGSVGFLVGCAATPAPSTPTPTPHGTPRPSAATPIPVPAPQGPFAVLVTNTARTGTTYDVLIMDAKGRVVARATAQLPRLKPNQTLDLPLVSASNTTVYYLDGDTDIHSLSPNGAATLVKAIPDGATSAVTFAVSPDDKRFAVAVITEQADNSKDTGHGYVEDLLGTGNRVELFNNIGQAAVRWPAGWHGGSIIDALSSVGYECYGPGSCGTRVRSYHVVDAASGNRTSTICEATDASAGGDNYNVQGLPTAKGVACEETQYDSVSSSYTDTLMRVDWAGSEHQFLAKSGVNYYGLLNMNSCALSSDGAQMACTSNANSALALISADGSRNDTGRRYQTLGWIDAGHLLVDIDPTTLGVLSVATGSVVGLPFTGADKVAMATALPGSL